MCRVSIFSNREQTLLEISGVKENVSLPHAFTGTMDIVPKKTAVNFHMLRYQLVMIKIIAEEFGVLYIILINP